MPPEDVAGRALEDAAGVGRALRQTAFVGNDQIQPDRVGRAIGAALQRAARQTERVAQLAAIEERAVVPALVGIHVGDEQLRDRPLVKHRPVALAVLVFHERDDRAAAGLEPHVELPPIPSHHRAVAREAGSHRLRDVERRQRGPRRPERLRMHSRRGAVGTGTIPVSTTRNTFFSCRSM